METTTKTPWRDVPLFWLDGGRALTDAERVKALRECRRTNGIYGVTLVDPADYDADGRIDGRTDLPDLTEAGPAPEDIDWTGFPIEITLTAEDRRGVITAALSNTHASGGPRNHYGIAIWPDGTHRVAYDQQTHFRPEPALWLAPADLLDPDYEYTWGESDRETPDAEADPEGYASWREEVEDEARAWIESNLRSGDVEIEMPDGSTQTVTVRWKD